MGISSILEKNSFTKQDIITLLKAQGHELKLLLSHSRQIREKIFNRKVFYRAIIEFSNICRKNCLYCGIRRENKHITRFELTDNQILKAAEFAFNNGIYSIVLQSGERADTKFINKISKLIQKLKQFSNGKIGITLSVGEHEYDVYKHWFELGAHRYLLRIEVSNQKLYSLYHPKDKLHSYHKRLECLHYIKDIGYQVGTGIMIGLPFQTIEDLADDLLFFKNFDIDMLGMGPYIEHKHTPLYKYRNLLLPLEERLMLTMKMNAILRILMPDINIAATTALQAIDPMGREKALDFACNVIMPNITPEHREDYFLYDGKPCVEDGAQTCVACLNKRLEIYKLKPILHELGDSPHYFKRIKSKIKN